MSDELGNIPPEPTYTSPPPPPPGYTQAPPPPPGYAPPPTEGLSDTAAGALAYVTIIPAIIFLLVAPYNTKPFVKFHSFQCLGLAVVGILLHVLFIIPILGFIIWAVGWVCLIVVWALCILKASQGGSFKLPVIGKFAAEQSGYVAA